MIYTLKCTHAGESYAFDILFQDRIIGGVALPRVAVNDFIHNVWNGGIDWSGHLAPE